MNPFHVIAGPPGAGKSTTLAALAPHINVVAEPARRVLAAERASGGRGTGDQDPELFVALMLETARADYRAASGPTIFDRGLPDLLAFCAHYGICDAAVFSAVEEYRYARTVFWFPPWLDIYVQDDERKLDYAGAVAFGDRIAEAYRRSGYTLVPVPQTPPDERAAFILSQIAD